MPYNVSTGVYAPPDGAEDAVPGEVIRSATWNTIFTDLSNALTQVGTQQIPGIHNLQASLGMAFVTFLSRNVNFNAGTTDTSIPVLLPTGYSLYLPSSIIISNVGGYATLTAATCGVFTSPSGAGATVVASGTALTIVSNQPNTPLNAQQLIIVNANTEYYNSGTIYFRVQTPTGTAATANVLVRVIPVS